MLDVDEYHYNGVLETSSERNHRVEEAPEYAHHNRLDVDLFWKGKEEVDDDGDRRVQTFSLLQGLLLVYQLEVDDVLVRAYYLFVYLDEVISFVNKGIYKAIQYIKYFLILLFNISNGSLQHWLKS